MDAPKPGDFPVGSVESRAAMRLQLSNQGQKPCMEIVSRIPRPWRGDGPVPSDWNKVPRVSAPQPWGDGLMRILYVPTGMAEGEARKIAEVGPRFTIHPPRSRRLPRLVDVHRAKQTQA